jgi:hypothetical protein
MDKRKTWREQEQRVVESWNTAIARYRDVQAEVERERGAPGGGGGASEELRLKEEAARAEVEAVRKQVARLKVEFSSGKRY